MPTRSTHTAGSVQAAVPAPRRRPGAEAESPLGSLTQGAARGSTLCPSCSGASLTQLSMVLTDGTPVQFTSCRSCEHRRWEADGTELLIGDVLDRTRS